MIIVPSNLLLPDDGEDVINDKNSISILTGSCQRCRIELDFDMVLKTDANNNSKEESENIMENESELKTESYK